MWRGALVAHERWVKGKGAEEIAALRAGPSTAFGGPPPPDKLGEELIGSQLKRVGHDRWSERKEKLFFDELAASANVKRAAAAAGVSTNAVYARRMKHALFRAKWEAVLETGRAAIEMKLVEAANRSFDPEELDVAGVDVSLGSRLADGRVAPVVSVAEAIRIVQLHGSRTQREAVGKSLQQQAGGMSGTDVDELRERVFKKIQRLRERDRRDRLAEGWTLDERHDCLVPPGWLRTV
jgi:hypothetical protein